MTFEERAEQLQNLKDQAGLNPADPKDQLLAAIADSLSMVCHQVYSISEINDGLNESVAVLEEQMQLLFEAEPEDEEPEDYFDQSETPLYQVKCPECGDQFAVDEDSLVKGFECPNCGVHLVQG